jgi:VanZ family protein
MQQITALSPFFLSVYLALLAWLSLSPARLYRGFNLTWLPGDMVIHFLLYLVLAVLLFLSLLRFHSNIIKISTFNMLIAFTVGLIMELLQLWLVFLNRSFERNDILMNFFGAVAGTLLCFVFLRRVKLNSHGSFL